MTTFNANAVLDATQQWLMRVVIGHNLCPFAKREVDLHRIRFYVDEHLNLADCLATCVEEWQYLDANETCETTLLCYAHAFSDFNDYLDFFYMAECLLADEGYEGMYQLASFHPDYCFNDAPADDPANYTNRSPYPMVHILREHSLTKAIDQHPNAEEIPERNIALTRQLGLEAMQQLLDSCYQR
ncbi:MAG: DUF1415 domain-containing protein [Methylovulum sp.]|nr:DUF1415 domain-containing protein [Methylovulum sp.]